MDQGMSSRIKPVSEQPLRTASNKPPVENSKVNDFRRQTATRDEEESEVPVPPTLSQDRRGWSYFMQRNSVLRTYQKRLVLNNDIKVTGLEFAIMFLSVAQLQWSYYRHTGTDVFKNEYYQREKRACAHRTGCVDTLADNSFIVANVVRVAIAILALVRLFIRFSQLWKTKCHTNITIRGKLVCIFQYGLELVYTGIFPYPGLESFFPSDRGDIFVLLSISSFLRSTSWGQWLYYPYPVRQKEKVASFSGNLEFSYRQFVIKKVLDDNPIDKLIGFYTLLGATVAYLLHVMETINGHCLWEDDTSEVVRSEDAICYELSISDSLWMVFMTFLSIGYGDVSPKTGRGQVIISLTACIAVLLDSIFFSIIIKKFNFSTMEARVHAFLYRMELYKKRDASAVMAVQATIRYNKLYKHSLIWHQKRGSTIFYRPLSDRLPNEVKKKLYASRFQKSLKQIAKYNTDGDPLNAFSKHVEVITAALGATFADMIRLKKMYYRRIRVLEQRRQQVTRRTSNIVMAWSGLPMFAPSSEVQRNLLLLAPLEARKPDLPTANQVPCIRDGVAVDKTGTHAKSGGVSIAWSDEMQRKCEATMILLKKMEANMKEINRTRSW